MSARISILSAGLRWLYTTEQPEGALVSHRGETLIGDDRTYRFVPQGAAQLPVVVASVRCPQHRRDAIGDLVPANPLDVNEVYAVLTDLAMLGTTVAATWNGYPSHSVSLGLVAPAHPSLLAALERDRAGCPDHAGQLLCNWDGCPWYGAGHALLVRPAVLEKDTRGSVPHQGGSTPVRRSRVSAVAAFLAGARNGRSMAGDLR
ncbi:hypothetical protein OHT52_21310 [Streptomyces sp. NBC_00247]|uniref:hypothetical protein n=1 Tax=Streptomyces sp. NBC_00247 TaxID=2975689 RepID=UPI002E2C4B20|nr:hypothetical protein [Streptomyces sp. NBC_00247]